MQNHSLFTKLTINSPYGITRKSSYLTLTKKEEYNKIIKRFMMAEGSVLTPQQKKAAALVLTIHAKFLSIKISTEEDLLQNFRHGMLVAGKPFQHFIAVLYKNKKFSTETVKKTFPYIGFDDQKPFLEIDHVLAIAAGSFIKEQSFFINSILYAYAAPNYTSHTKLNLDVNSTAFKQTGQHHPDYGADFPQYNTSRYYDLKTGNIDCNSGHLKIIADSDEFEKISKQLFYAQHDWVHKNYPKSLLAKKFQQLKTEIKIEDTNWENFYISYQIIIQPYFKNYLEFNPTFVYKSKVPYEIINQKSNKSIEGILNTDSCQSLEDTQKTLHAILESSSSTIQKNYFKFNPLGFGDKNKTLYLLKNLVNDVLS